jgi:hypothetical protein
VPLSIPDSCRPQGAWIDTNVVRFLQKNYLDQVMKEFAARIVNKPKTKKKQPIWKIDSKMTAKIISNLTMTKAQYSI